MSSVSRRSVIAGALGAATGLMGACGGGSGGADASANNPTGPAPAPPPAAAPPPPPPPPAPSWAARARAGTWNEVPMGRTLAAIDPIKDPNINPNFQLPDPTPEWAPNAEGFKEVVAAWCGAAFNEQASEMWLGMGGGHNAYAGNEIVACNFESEAPAWRMVRKPSGAIGNLLTTRDGLEATGLYSDGRPRAIHTANKWCYVPGVGPALMALGHGSWSFFGTPKTWSIFVNESSGESAFTAELPGIYLGPVDDAGTCYDPTRHAIWISIRNSWGMLRYDVPATGAPQAGRLTSVNRDDPGYGNQNLCYLPGHDCILAGDSYDDDSVSRWRVFDCAANRWYYPTFVNPRGAAMALGSTQCRWVPSLGAACFWDNATQTTLVSKVTPGANPRTDTWTVSTLPVSSSNTVIPTARALRGTFGRFAYAPNLGGFLVFNSYIDPVYFYKI